MVILAACSPEKPIREVIVVGTFVADEAAALQLFYADDLSPVTDARVEITSADATANLLWNGINYSTSDDIVHAGAQLSVAFAFEDHAAAASVKVPPAIAPINLGNTLIAINPNSTGSPALVLQWTPLPASQYSYLLQLEPLDASPEAIPFTVPAGRFDVQYSGPIAQTGTILFDTDFKYYGPHRLTIYAIDKSFEEMFFYNKSDLRGLALLSPDNIQNAKGFLTAVSKTSILLTIQ